MTDHEQRTRTESVRKHEIWVWPVVMALTVTAFVIGWVTVTKTLADKDLKIKQTDSDMQVKIQSLPLRKTL